ncbi:MAG TPA: pyridoxal phosphate-dependent aminotransferase [Candidatus Brocadiia bacterium]|nr:pyridoxal phosphate-dependent aminotransferase [Candidatus Brocadiia bacterium]
MKPLSETGRLVADSPTLAMGARLKKLKSEGKTVYDFTVGQPDFDTPEHIKQAAIEALKKGETGYTPAAGMPDLKKAIAAKFKKENGIDYSPDQIFVSNGAKHTLYHVFQMLAGPGDEVIIPAPYWVSYSEQVQMAGGTSVLVKAGSEQGFRVTAAQIEAAITNRTKALLVNSPSNPTGAVYTEQELRDICELAVSRGIYIVSDEIYEHFIYGGQKAVSPAAFGPAYKDAVITVNGVSKTYAMTGWRIGYAAGPVNVIRQAGFAQSNATGCPCSISQRAAQAAILGDQTCVANMVAEFDKRRIYMTERLNAMKVFSCDPPAGAFYCFPRCDALYGKRIGGVMVENSTALCEALLDKAGVGCVQGGPFGADECIRFSYATGMETIRKGMDAVEALVKGTA